MSDMKFHPVAEIFPLMSDEDVARLSADIKENGLREPIHVFDDAIIDGRNRFRACKMAGVRPEFLDYQGDEDSLVEFAVSLNLHRRHLTESQRAVVASNIATLEQGANLHLGVKISEAASMMGVSERSVKSAKKVKDKAHKSVVDAVISGAVPVSVGAQMADQPKEVQEEFVKQISEGKKPSAAARASKRAADDDKRISTPKVKGKFQTIMVDPPWDHETFSLAGRGLPEYSVLSQDDLMNGPESSDLWIPDWADEQCHLYLWVTNNFLTRGVDLIQHWGFDYKTIVTWVKPRFGMGSYLRSSTEHMLFATKGETLTTRVNNIPTHFEAPLGKHSAKPDRAYEIAELASYPNRLEVFPGRERKGWTRWGIPNE